MNELDIVDVESVSNEMIVEDVCLWVVIFVSKSEGRNDSDEIDWMLLLWEDVEFFE